MRAGEEALLRTVRRVFASLYTNRAISYRVHHGFEHAAVALSCGIQKMVRADLGCSGVIFTLDTESGFPDVCMVTGAWGLGETVVQARCCCCAAAAALALRHDLMRADAPCTYRCRRGAQGSVNPDEVRCALLESLTCCHACFPRLADASTRLLTRPHALTPSGWCLSPC